MNRPPKKHKSHKDDILEDPRFEHEDLVKADKKLHEKDAVKDDDRNLVHVDDAFKEADIEDQVWLFWNKYKGMIFIAIAAVFIGVVGAQAYKFYQSKATQDMQEAYSAAETTEEKAAFGEQYAGTPLAGLALLETADVSYRDADYAAAAASYKSASASLADTYLLGRARLGEAMSHYKAGNADLANSQLLAINSDSTVLAALRAEATFNLGVIALGNKDYATARTYLDQVKAIDGKGLWGTQATTLETQVPELAAPETPEAPAKPAEEAAPTPGS